MTQKRVSGMLSGLAAVALMAQPLLAGEMLDKAWQDATRAYHEAVEKVQHVMIGITAIDANIKKMDDLIKQMEGDSGKAMSLQHHEQFVGAVQASIQAMMKELEGISAVSYSKQHDRVVELARELQQVQTKHNRVFAAKEQQATDAKREVYKNMAEGTSTLAGAYGRWIEKFKATDLTAEIKDLQGWAEVLRDVDAYTQDYLQAVHVMSNMELIKAMETAQRIKTNMKLISEAFVKFAKLVDEATRVTADIQADSGLKQVSPSDVVQPTQPGPRK